MTFRPKVPKIQESDWRLFVWLVCLKGAHCMCCALCSSLAVICRVLSVSVCLLVIPLLCCKNCVWQLHLRVALCNKVHLPQTVFLVMFQNFSCHQCTLEVDQGGELQRHLNSCRICSHVYHPSDKLWSQINFLSEWDALHQWATVPPPTPNPPSQPSNPTRPIPTRAPEDDF